MMTLTLLRALLLGDYLFHCGTDEEMSQLRGTDFYDSDPLSALTPMFSIGDQLAEYPAYP